MVLETQIKATIVAWVDKQSFNDGINYARDTWKKLNQDLKLKLELDVANLQLQVDNARKILRDAKKTWDKDAIINAQLNTNQLKSSLTEATRQLRNYVNTWDKDLSRLQAKFNWLWASARQAINDFWKTILWWALAVGIQRTASSVITLAGNLEQARIAFTTLTGSAETANVLLKDLADFAKATPFELTWLREQSKLLLAYWFEANEIIPTLEALGNIAAWVGVDKLPRLTYALWQVRAAWRLTGQDFRQFTETGVNLGEELQKITGITEKINSANVADLWITYEQVQAALANLWWEAGRFWWLMEAQSQTLQGSISNLKDWLNILWEEIWSTFIPALSWIVKSIIPTVEKFGEFAKESPKVASWIASITAALWLLISAFVVLWWPLTLVIWWVAALTVAWVWLASKWWDVRREFDLWNRWLKDLQWNPTELWKEIEALKQKGNEVAISFNNAKEAQEAYWALKLNQSATRAELEATRQAAIKSTRDVIASLQALLNAQLWFEQQVLRNFQSTTKSIWWLNVWDFGSIVNKTNEWVNKKLKEQLWILDELEKKTYSIQWAGPILPLAPDDKWWKWKKEKKDTEWLSSKYEKTKRELDDLFIWTEEFNVKMKELLELEKEVEKQWWKTFGEMKKELKEVSEQRLKDVKEKWEATFKSIEDAIDESVKSVEKLKDELKGISDELETVENDIWKRIIEIEEDLKSINLDISAWEADVEAFEEKKKLEEELALAKQNINAEALEAIRQEEAKSETQKLLDRQNELLAKQAKLQLELEQEESFQSDLTNIKEEFAKKVTEIYWIELKKQTDIVKTESLKQIASYKAIEAAAKAAAAAWWLSWWDGWTIPGRAVGWPVSWWSPYIVGERGPELFVPNKNGEIIPNNTLTNNINVNANVSNDIDLDMLWNSLAQKIALSKKWVF